MVAINSIVNCTTITRFNNALTITNSVVLIPVANRTVAVSQTGGPGVFTMPPTGLIASSFSFSYQTPSKSGPMTIWDSVSGNNVLLQVFETYNGEVIAAVGSKCN